MISLCERREICCIMLIVKKKIADPNYKEELNWQVLEM